MRFLLAGLMAAAVGLPAFAQDKAPIRIAYNEWTGQNLSAKIAGSILQEMGHKVEYVTAGAVPQYIALADGSLNVNPEIWTNNVGEIYPKAIASGDIVVVGDLGLTPIEGWFYPPYMEELCPGLPSYTALYECAQAFGAAETFPKGRVITYPADWGTREKDLIADIELPFVPVAGGSEGAMIAELKSALDAKQPILMMFWAPHWLHAEIKLNIVEWDKTGRPCITGEKQARGDACGFQRAEVKKVVSANVKEKWPDAYAMLQKFSIENDEQNAMLLKVDKEGRSVDDVADEWMTANTATWKSWTK